MSAIEDKARSLLSDPSATPLQLADTSQKLLSEKVGSGYRLGHGITSLITGVRGMWDIYGERVESYAAFAQRLGASWVNTANPGKAVQAGKQLLSGILNETDPSLISEGFDAAGDFVSALPDGFVGAAQIIGSTAGRAVGALGKGAIDGAINGFTGQDPAHPQSGGFGIGLAVAALAAVTIAVAFLPSSATEGSVADSDP